MSCLTERLSIENKNPRKTIKIETPVKQSKYIKKKKRETLDSWGEETFCEIRDTASRKYR